MTALPAEAQGLSTWLFENQLIVPRDLFFKTESAIPIVTAILSMSPSDTAAFKREMPETWAKFIKDLSDFADAYEAWSKSSEPTIQMQHEGK